MKTFALLLASAAACALSLSVAPARPAQGSPTACAKGSVKATIGGHPTCLRAGDRCQSRYGSQYRRHGFACVKGRLRKVTKKPKPAPQPKPTPYPPSPPLPSGPAVTTLRLPSASALPTESTKIALPTSSWSPGIGDLAVSSDAVWVSSGVFRLDPASNAVTGPLTSFESQDITTGEGSIWASGYAQDVVRRIDPATGKELAVIQLPVGSSPEGLTDAAGSIWVANHHGGTLSRIDPQTNKVVATIALTYNGRSGPQGIASGVGSIWVSIPNINAVVRVDPATNKIAAFVPFPPAMSPCGGIAAGQTAVWVTSCLDGTTIGRIDAATNKVFSILDVGGEVIQPAADGDTVWFVAGGDPDSSPNEPGFLTQLRADDTVATRIDLGPGFISGGTAVAFGSIWVSDFAHPRVLRVPHPS